MKKYLSLIVFVILTSNLLAQTADEKAVAAAVESLRVVMIDPNKSTLEGIVADNLSYGHSSGKVDDKAAFIESLISGKSDFTSIALSDQVIKVTDNTAVVRHVFKGETLANGTPGVANINVILVWVKLKGQWKLLARQALKIV
jgi:Domain of unknown function (DUF4440)